MLAPDHLRLNFVVPGAWMGILWTSRGGGCNFRFPEESIVLFNILCSLATASEADVTFT